MNDLEINLITEKIQYIAAVLTKQSQHELFDNISKLVEIPDNWRKIGHHMTVEFNKAKEYAGLDYFNGFKFGTVVYMMPMYYKMDDKAIAVVPACLPSAKKLGVSNKMPHITVAVAPGIQPVYSNSLLESGNLIKIDVRIMLEARLAKVVSGLGPMPKMGEYASDIYSSTT